MFLQPLRSRIIVLLFAQALLMYLFFGNVWGMRSSHTVLLLLPSIVLEIYAILYIMSICNSENKKGGISCSTVSMFCFVLGLLLLTFFIIAHAENSFNWSINWITCTFFIDCLLLSLYIYFKQTVAYLPTSDVTRFPGSFNLPSQHINTTGSETKKAQNSQFIFFPDHEEIYEQNDNHKAPSNHTILHTIYHMEVRKGTDCNTTNQQTASDGDCNEMHKKTISGPGYANLIFFIMLQGLFVLLYFGPLHLNNRVDTILLVMPSVALICLYLFCSVVDIYYTYSNKNILRLQAEFTAFMLVLLYVMVCVPMYYETNFDSFVKLVMLLFIVILGATLLVRCVFNMYHKQSPTFII